MFIPKYGKYIKYVDEEGHWRWRYKAFNGRTLAVSSEAYAEETDCTRIIEILQASENDPIEVQD